jgi:hypothetical protein
MFDTEGGDAQPAAEAVVTPSAVITPNVANVV